MTDPARVTISVGYTKNMGDFNSLRIDVGVEDSVRPGEDLDAAANRIYTFVSDQLVARIKEETEG
jgi:hypothetical protein